MALSSIYFNFNAYFTKIFGGFLKSQRGFDRNPRNPFRSATEFTARFQWEAINIPLRSSTLSKMFDQFLNLISGTAQYVMLTKQIIICALNVGICKDSHVHVTIIIKFSLMYIYIRTVHMCLHSYQTW